MQPVYAISACSSSQYRGGVRLTSPWASMRYSPYSLFSPLDGLRLKRTPVPCLAHDHAVDYHIARQKASWLERGPHGLRKSSYPVPRPPSTLEHTPNCALNSWGGQHVHPARTHIMHARGQTEHRMHAHARTHGRPMTRNDTSWRGVCKAERHTHRTKDLTQTHRPQRRSRASTSTRDARARTMCGRVFVLRSTKPRRGSSPPFPTHPLFAALRGLHIIARAKAEAGALSLSHTHTRGEERQVWVLTEFLPRFPKTMAMTVTAVPSRSRICWISRYCQDAHNTHTH